MLLFILFASCQRDEKVNREQRQEAIDKDLISTSYLLNRDKKCFTSQVGDIACSYEIGDDLKFTIWGIGEKDSMTIVDKTIGEEGEYQIRFSASDPCIRVKLGEKSLNKYSITNPFHDLTFVSPKTGRAYGSYDECIDSIR